MLLSLGYHFDVYPAFIKVFDGMTAKGMAEASGMSINTIA
jgi:hypothetical protein